VRPVLEYVSACWDLHSEDQVIVSERVQKQAAIFVTRTNESVRETLVQLRKISRLWSLFKGNTGERAWKATGDRLQGLCYLSREDRNRKIRGRKKRTGIGKYSFAKRNIVHAKGNFLHNI
jgi:hypothetical protein